jgi:hypothetical protein
MHRRCRPGQAHSGKFGRGVVGRIEQAVERHEQLNLDADIGRAGLAGEPFHQGVGRDLIPSPLIALGAQAVGVPSEGCQAGHPCSSGR